MMQEILIYFIAFCELMGVIVFFNSTNKNAREFDRKLRALYDQFDVMQEAMIEIQALRINLQKQRKPRAKKAVLPGTDTDKTTQTNAELRGQTTISGTE